ncbi:hypothetical protein BDV95DRAFT_364068 [Massariosphaeria phaeospora]|uniref:Uncharacterized protein n=1 Tax=Massariosphaeria phaeospora TaxID=100035 RepID=A0A7C8MR74_9PLEO|nr:hypothetical protein BDV95DRAFT_364068 [Massariosphaeria phaeospora]
MLRKGHPVPDKFILRAKRSCTARLPLPANRQTSSSLAEKLKIELCRHYQSLSTKTSKSCTPAVGPAPPPRLSTNQPQQPPTPSPFVSIRRSLVCIPTVFPAGTQHSRSESVFNSLIGHCCVSLAVMSPTREPRDRIPIMYLSIYRLNTIPGTHQSTPRSQMPRSEKKKPDASKPGSKSSLSFALYTHKLSHN